MSNDVKVNPTPIQRNRFDVAMELTQLHLQNFPIDQDDLESLFAKYFAVASYCDSNGYRMEELVSENVKVAKARDYNF